MSIQIELPGTIQDMTHHRLQVLHAYQQELQSEDINDFCFKECPTEKDKTASLVFNDVTVDTGSLADIFNPTPVHALYNFMTSTDIKYLTEFHDRFTTFTNNLGNCKEGSGHDQQDPMECFIIPLLDRIGMKQVVYTRSENSPYDWDRYDRPSVTELHSVIPNLTLPPADTVGTTINDMVGTLNKVETYEDDSDGTNSRFKHFKIMYPTQSVDAAKGNFGFESKYTLTDTMNFVCLGLARKDGRGAAHNRLAITIDKTLDGIKDIAGKDVILNLQSIIQHRGVDGSGHYIAYVRNGGQWYKCDDSKVSEVTTGMNSILTNNKGVYVVMYTRGDIVEYNLPAQKLENARNLCYRNASLQMLWAEPSIREAIKTKCDKLSEYYKFIKYIE